jgi:hypothetical protein
MDDSIVSREWANRQLEPRRGWLSFRASALCAARNLGEPREASRPLKRNNRAFGELPFQIQTPPPTTAFPPRLAYNEAAEDTHGLAAK